MTEEKQEPKKVQLKDFKLNCQKADNLAQKEMVPRHTAALHYFYRLAGIDFVDVNQKDLCRIDGKLAYVKKFDQTNEIDIFEDDLNGRLKDVELFIYFGIDKGNIVFLGFVDRAYVDGLEMGFHFKAKKNCKKINYDTLTEMSELLEIFVEEEIEEEIKQQPFVHQHVHTEFSIGDGYSTPKYLAEQAKKKGFKACAITDHGSLAGTIYFQKACLEAGIKPIFGIEAYVYLFPEAKENFHLVLLVKNEIGWKNLLKLNDKACREGFYYRPRMLLKDILEHHEGLICLTACQSGILGRFILNNESAKAQTQLRQLKETFKDDLYIELMPNKMPEQIFLNKELVNLAKSYNIKTVITTDSHYCNQDEEKYHRAINAIKWKKKYKDAGFGDDTFYLMKEDEIKVLIKEHHSVITEELIKDSFKNSLDIAEKCNYKIEFEKKDTLPKLYDNPNEKLKQLTYEGLEKYTPYKLSDPKIKDRLDLELERFISKDYANYFLVVYDYVQWCKKNGIMVGPGRGSVGGSLVAYALNITEIDPLEFSLSKDRFISEARHDAPDIDLDFEDNKREQLLEYLKEKYGEERYAKIITYSRWHAKGVLRDMGRIFDIPMDEINNICNVVITRSGGDARQNACVEDTFNEFENAKEFRKKYPEACDIAIKLEGNIRNVGVHAAAVILTENPIDNYIPVTKLNGEICSAWEKKEVESAGLIKFDILGLKTLSVINETLQNIKKSKDLEVILPRKFDDKKVFDEVLSKGKTLGIFQLETTGMSKLSKQLGINNFKTLYDATTLYRPGPLHSGQTADYVLRHLGKKEWEYDHKLLEPITKETHGLILYQEQVMQIMYELGSFSWATAEASRKIMTKSQGKDAFNKMRAEFIRNAKRDHKIPEEESEKIFDVVCTFGSYGFNKSHACEYSIISYWCAWLKTYYPAEFFASLLTREQDANQISNYVRDAKEFGVTVSLPHINKSKLGYNIIGNEIVAGIDSIFGLGIKSAEKLIKNQPYDLMSLIKNKPGKTIWINLAKSGALDSFGIPRKTLVEYEPKRKELLTLDKSKFVEYDEKELILEQMKVLNLPSEKPAIDCYENPFADKIKFEKLGEMEFEEYVPERWVKGIVTFINFKQEGLEGQWTMFDNVLERRYAHLNINDGTGNVLVHLAPEQYTYYKEHLEKGTGFPVIIKGHTIPNFNKIYCDGMIVLNDIDYDLPLIKYLKENGRKDKALQLKAKFGQYTSVKVIQNVTYKVSKNKKPYARIKFYDDEEYYLIFNLTSKIFVTGEILVFSCFKKPFINIKARY